MSGKDKTCTFGSSHRQLTVTAVLFPEPDIFSVFMNSDELGLEEDGTESDPYDVPVDMVLSDQPLLLQLKLFLPLVTFFSERELSRNEPKRTMSLTSNLFPLKLPQFMVFNSSSSTIRFFQKFLIANLREKLLVRIVLPPLERR